MKIRFLNDEIEEFITSLEENSIAKVLRTIDLLERFGNKLGLPHSKKVSKNLFELRIHGVQNIRIFYAFHNDSAVLLNGFKKKTQRTPKREINIALQRLKNLDNI